MGSKIFPPGFHTIEQGDWISKLAKWYGIPKWETIWNHEKNSQLRELRKSPNILYPGDKVFIPDIEIKEESASTEKQHNFVLKDEKINFQTAILDEENKPRPGIPYKFTVNNKTVEGKTDANGVLKQPIPRDAEMAALEIDGQFIQIQLGYLDPIDTILGIQARLDNLGYEPGEIDGVIGEETSAAITAFQEDYPPLIVDGICGPETQQKLKEIYGS